MPRNNQIKAMIKINHAWHKYCCYQAETPWQAPQIEAALLTRVATARPFVMLSKDDTNLPVAQKQVRCVFLVHAIESWDALRGVYLAMIKDERFLPIVISINRHFPGDLGYGHEEITSRELDNLGIPHGRLGMSDQDTAYAILKELAPDVIFRQSQWEIDVPPAFRTEQLCFTRLCSLPYGMSIVSKFSTNEDTSSEISPKSYNQVYHQRAWRVFCETELTRSYFLRFHPGKERKFVLSGYPKLTTLLEARSQPEYWPIERGKRYFRIIWAPHHSVTPEWLGFGVFHRIFAAFLDWAKKSPELEFVLKPHPGLFSNLTNSGVLPKAILDQFINDWSGLSNCVIENNLYAHLFAASDLMITDGLSFLTEYPAFEKPLIFFDSGHHVPMNPIGQVALDCAHVVRTFDEMRAATMQYAHGAAFEGADQRRKLLDLLFPTEKPPTEVILHAIADGVHEERKAMSAIA